MSWSEAEYAAYLRRQGQPLSGDTPEGTLLAEIRKLAEPHGWWTYHAHDARKSEPGWPDLVLCDGTDLLIYELKTNTGKATAEQQRWLSLLAHTGKVETGIWRTRDWPAIAARLTRRSPV